MQRLIVLLLCCLQIFDCAIIIAHRGASAYLPEHTLEAKSLAYAMGADFLEQDLVLSKDNVPIVLHDIYLDEVTDVSTKYPERVRNDSRFYAIDFTVAEIKTLKVTERYLANTNMETPRFAKRFPLWKSSFQLSTFQDEIELVQGLQKSLKQSANYNGKVVGIYPEIKNPKFHADEGRPNFSEIVLQILKEYNYTKKSDPVYLQCFDPFELKRIKNELKTDLKLIQLLDLETESYDHVNYTYWNSLEGLTAISKFADGIGPNKDLLLKIGTDNKINESEFAANAKKLKLEMHPWTFRHDSLPKYATSHDQLMRIFVKDLKVEGVFTDFPDLAYAFLHQSNASGHKVLSFALLVSSVVFALLCRF